MLGQDRRGAPGFQTGWGPPPSLLGLGIIPFMNAEHLGNFGAKKRSSWLEVVRIPEPVCCQGGCLASALLLIIKQLWNDHFCSPDPRLELCARYSPAPTVLTTFHLLNLPER